MLCQLRGMFQGSKISFKYFLSELTLGFVKDQYFKKLCYQIFDESK